MKLIIRTLLCGLAAGLTACASAPTANYTPPEVKAETKTGRLYLDRLPAPRQKVVVAVYDFADETGQYKQLDNIASYSRAVTQGGTSILVKSLLEAGGGSWFTVVERHDLADLLNERQIMRETRGKYLGERGEQLPPPRPLLVAGVLLQGGIVGYDTNVRTGGAGARYLGIGASTEYREDTVTVYLRLVSTQTGEVLMSVTTEKRIYSHALQGEAFRYVAADEILELEAGYARNEPGLIALREAIDKAVFALVVEGAEKDLWNFSDDAAGQQIMRYYEAMRERDSGLDGVPDASAPPPIGAG